MLSSSAISYPFYFLPFFSLSICLYFSFCISFYFELLRDLCKHRFYSHFKNYYSVGSFFVLIILWSLPLIFSVTSLLMQLYMENPFYSFLFESIWYLSLLSYANTGHWQLALDYLNSCISLSSYSFCFNFKDF